ncbi:MAG: RNA polymerase sigma factor [Vicinamibacterales bacterium]|mgnify:CR=1 FL=1|nr:RNA polymerase sigma factor [Vicinamibacterales bacterium]MDP7691749.1 RNA polymerase sigma factor [Vicinamibacterales bacterium]
MIDVGATAAPLLTGTGDPATTFETLYRTHARRIYSLAYRFVGNSADAEELLQEIFLQAHRRLDSFRQEAALSTWLHRLAVNRCLDHVRSRGARQAAHTDSLDDQAVAAPRARVSTDTITRLDLEQAVAKLPDGYRTVFILHDVEGYEHREIAELLGIAVGTSKSQVHKARLKLRTLLRRT